MRDKVRVSARGRRRLRALIREGGLETIIIDVDGTLTDGSIYVDESGKKTMKRFGPDDHDVLDVARLAGLKIFLCSADKAGFEISAARAAQLGFECHLVPTLGRMLHFWGQHDVNLRRTAYIGDGFWDYLNFHHCSFGIAVADAFPRTIKAADAVTSRPGGRRAVAQAIDFLIKETQG